jgi:negative regulator of flagellin synthesis FlgM
MVNQINDSSGVKTIKLDSQLKAKNQQNNAPAAESTVSTDSVNFSSTSKQLDSIKASLMNEPQVDSAKVAHFKAQIASGNYQVNSGAIANKMVHNSLEPA